MNRSALVTLALVLFGLSVFATAAGGMMDLVQTGGLSKRHAWSDGIYLVLAAVFVLLLAKQ